MEAGPALGGQLTAAVASVPRRAGASGSAIRVVSTPARRGERARHTHRQYPIAPGSVSAPSESVPRPHRRRLRRGVRRARLVPQLPADSRTERTDVRTDSDRRLGQTGPLVAGTCPLPASTGGPRVDGPTGRRPLSPRYCPTRRTARTNGLHRVTAAAGTEPDPGPCLRRWGLRHRPMSRVRAGVAVEAACFLVRKHESGGAGDVRLLTATPPSPPPGNEPGPGGEVPNLGGKRGGQPRPC